MDWKQIKIFLQGFAVVLVLVAMTVCSVCAFNEGNALTIISGIANAVVAVGLCIYLFKQIDKEK